VGLFTSSHAGAASSLWTAPLVLNLRLSIANLQFLRFRRAIENHKSPIDNLLVWDHAQDFVQVTVTHQSGMS